MDISECDLYNFEGLLFEEIVVTCHKIYISFVQATVVFSSVEFFMLQFFSFSFSCNNEQKQYLGFIEHTTLAKHRTQISSRFTFIHGNIILFSHNIYLIFLASFLPSCMTLPTFHSTTGLTSRFSLNAATAAAIYVVQI